MTVRVLIIDDSTTMRRLLSAIMDVDPEIEVVGTAANADEARRMIKKLNPDVLTLDVEMPGMNGLDFLTRLMKLRPMPVIMISSHTDRGAQASIEALARGALSCFPKPRFDDEQMLGELRKKVKEAAKYSSAIMWTTAAMHGKRESRLPALPHQNNPKLIMLGASTGGVEALSNILPRFPANCPPTVVVQHMPARFTKSLANRLNSHCAPRVQEAEDGTPLKPGHVYIAPGSAGHTVIDQSLLHPRCKIKPDTSHTRHIPSVDILFESVTGSLGKQISAAILTGMGMDGARGLLELKKNGAHTIAQDEATSVIYGMPAAAAKLGASCEILPLGEIAAALLKDRKNEGQNVNHQNA